MSDVFWSGPSWASAGVAHTYFLGYTNDYISRWREGRTGLQGAFGSERRTAALWSDLSIPRGLDGRSIMVTLITTYRKVLDDGQCNVLGLRF